MTKKDHHRQLTYMNNEELQEKLEPVSSLSRNSFEDIYVWLKGEILALQAMKDAIAGREALTQLQKNLDAKMRRR